MRLVLIFLLLATTVCRAADNPTFQTSAEEAILVDYDSGAILFEKEADKPFPPASMAKLMTLEVVFKKLKAGEITLDTPFPVSLYAWKTGGAPSRTTSMFVPLNTTATVGELIQGVIVQNANDACIALAEGLSGSEDAFAQVMTEEGKQIGLQKSVFANATGLPNSANTTTARDLATLANYIVREYPQYYTYFAQKEFKYRSHTFKNYNPILNANIGADGFNVGFAEGVGYGIVASALKDGRRLIAVMNGFEKEKDRREEPVKFLSWGFANFKMYKVFGPEDVVGEARVWGAEKLHIKVKAKSDVKILIPISAKDLRVDAKIVYLGPIKPPIQEGDRIGEVRVTSKAGTSNSAPVFAAESMQPAGLVRKGVDSLILGLDSAVRNVLKKVLKRQT